ncbi:uncharacterized protein BJ212DRAFT_1298680 [Suillus subaureus]|uniref:Uncharacterized protein n=1 Tax=Suillus subaureus TaxID=48587 RepID=A0A9P7EE91_9AGAM|nr:uncharacterized protein BJ212DRAFT_1298680 [Suillus subaureus]KAG1818610.1 hypothetical protein BJ212DRAFT_1298680 [Suillus subaureus]
MDLGDSWRSVGPSGSDGGDQMEDESQPPDDMEMEESGCIAATVSNLSCVDVLHCVYCTDVGSHIWACIGLEMPCDIMICVATTEFKHGCVDATHNPLTRSPLMTKDTFMCPQCYRSKDMAIPYMVHCYTIQSRFLMHNPALFLDDFRWVTDQNNHCNILVFINTYTDMSMGNLVALGGTNNSVSITPWEMLENYIGDHFQRASQVIRTINTSHGDKPFMHGLVLCSCGPTGQISNSVTLLKKMVE